MRRIPTPGDSHLSKMAAAYRPKEKPVFESEPVNLNAPPIAEHLTWGDRVFNPRPPRQDRVDHKHRSPNRGWR